MVRDAVNAHLRPNPIAVLAVEKVAGDFDARFSARKRHYSIASSAGALTWRSTAIAPGACRARLMQVRCTTPRSGLIGLHDFTTFRAAECQAKSPMKTLDRLDVVARRRRGARICASARSFLHHQVRSMVGSLVQVGDGKWMRMICRAWLAARDRTACGPVAPAEGLISGEGGLSSLQRRDTASSSTSRR